MTDHNDPQNDQPPADFVYTHRTRPQYVAAYQFINLRTWDQADWTNQLPAWLAEAKATGVVVTQGSCLLVMTQRGQITVRPTDWIVCRSDRTLVAADNQTFAILYEAWQRPLPFEAIARLDGATISNLRQFAQQGRASAQRGLAVYAEQAGRQLDDIDREFLREMTQQVESCDRVLTAIAAYQGDA